jgi:hypothetical protein
VIPQVLQGLAQACKYRIPKPLSLLRFAACCTVLRSRWYQSGISPLRIRYTLVPHLLNFVATHLIATVLLIGAQTSRTSVRSMSVARFHAHSSLMRP